jgi:hypothetical protein
MSVPLQQECCCEEGQGTGSRQRGGGAAGYGLRFSRGAFGVTSLKGAANRSAAWNHQSAITKWNVTYAGVTTPE